MLPHTFLYYSSAQPIFQAGPLPDKGKNWANMRVCSHISKDVYGYTDIQPNLPKYIPVLPTLGQIPSKLFQFHSYLDRYRSRIRTYMGPILGHSGSTRHWFLDDPGCVFRSGDSYENSWILIFKIIPTFL